ncbi:hypothetical protein RJ639_021429 [Escallonia herrerae]|uniref:Retrotransposon gag domain-containing protein n=1 Tax=Escallonia herrerae TaxID=1293975 RepID=A0AA88V361_9ASTE|nr:hypothetical protein RJ639_021429 [Escallonia herrerae]
MDHYLNYYKDSTLVISKAEPHAFQKVYGELIRHEAQSRPLPEVTPKTELNKQFYFENIKFEENHKLRRLRHTCSLWDYVKEYSTIILELHHMADMEALYRFMDGLQPWVA